MSNTKFDADKMNSFLATVEARRREILERATPWLDCFIICDMKIKSLQDRQHEVPAHLLSERDVSFNQIIKTIGNHAIAKAEKQ